MKAGLSVVILTKNEENNIIDCLESISFSDEIIVVDDESNDRTSDIAIQYKATVLHHAMNGNYAGQRNYALNFVHYKWVLFVDADERIGEKLKKEIIQAMRNDKEFNGYYFKRIDYMWGKPILHGEAANVRLLRLGRLGAGKWKGKVHEKWNINGVTDEFVYPLIHIPHQSVKNFIAEIDYYSTLRAEELTEDEKNSTVKDIVLYPIGKFFINFLLKKGYKDGIPGFIYAMMMSFHSFLVRAKLYQKNSEQ